MKSSWSTQTKPMQAEDGSGGHLELAQNVTQMHAASSAANLYISNGIRFISTMRYVLKTESLIKKDGCICPQPICCHIF